MVRSGHDAEPDSDKPALDALGDECLVCVADERRVKLDGLPTRASRRRRVHMLNARTQSAIKISALAAWRVLVAKLSADVF